jgi:hypothetical protein
VRERGLHLARGQRAAISHLPQHGLDEAWVFGVDLTHASPRLGLRSPHPTGEQRPGRGRDEGRLVRPVFDETTRRGVAHPIQRLAVIGAEAAEERQVMTARHDVDAVDLDDAEPVNDAAQVPGANRAGCGTRRGQPLSGQRDPPGLRSSQLTHRSPRGTPPAGMPPLNRPVAGE